MATDAAALVPTPRDPVPELETVRDGGRATTMLEHPLRAAILRSAVEVGSATEIAERLGETRQRVNYHVTRLREAGLLTPAGERQRRGCTERRYRASARSYVLAPAVLGPLAPSPRTVTDPLSAERLIALASRMQDEVARASAEARSRDQRLATLSIDADVRFGSAHDRAAFTRELHEAVVGLVARYGTSAEGRPYRLVIGAHPVPADEPGDPPAVSPLPPSPSTRPTGGTT
jgi:DNA-binding transcriptional ArsR family regulator